MMKKKISLAMVCLLAVSLCLALVVGAQNDPADAISLPAALIQGQTYDFHFPDTGLIVNGQPCEGSFVAEGNQTELVFTDSSGAEVGFYILPVINTDNAANHCAYFYDSDKALSVKENANDITLSFSKDSRISFIKALPADNFGLNLALADGVTNYQTFTLKLTDTADARNSLTFRFQPAEGTVSLQDEKAALDKAITSLQLRYKNSVAQLYISDKPVLSCKANDNGNAFEGFAGGVYMTLGFEGVAGKSEVAVTRLCNQPMGHKDSGAVDSTEPVIVLTSQLTSKLYMGDTFQIPTFRAYDVLSNITESSVSVELPDGTTVTEDFTVTQYGRYKITFTAKDSNSNKVKTTKNVYVNDDIVPELQVGQLEKTSYKVGSVVSIPTYTASDNLEMCYVDVILILPNSEVHLLTRDAAGEITYVLTDSTLYPASFRNDETSFKADQVGTYTLRYVAYDDQFNKTVQELTFTVK